jgi:hypothetical protein
VCLWCSVVAVGHAEFVPRIVIVAHPSRQGELSAEMLTQIYLRRSFGS